MAGVEELEKLVMSELDDYADEVEGVVQKVCASLAKEVQEDLLNNDGIPQQTGEYKKSFYVKKETYKNGKVKYRVANKKYRLTHLLEYGHAINGGTGRTRDFPHWIDGQEIADTLPERIKERLSQ